MAQAIDEPVEGRGAAADLVEHDEGARARLIEDRGRLDHLDHEGRAAAGEIVGRADAAEQTVDDADMRALLAGTNEPDCASTTISAFWRRKVDLPRHVGSGDDEDARVAAAVLQPSLQSLPTKLAPSPRRKVCSTIGWRPSSTAKTRLCVDLRAHIALLDGQLGEPGIVVELGKGRARRGERALLGEHRLVQSRAKIFELERKRAVGRLW